MRACSRIAALVLLLATGAQAEERRVLTVATWGGAYEAAQRAALFQPFTEATGVEIETVRYDGGVAALAEHLDAPGPPAWDVIDMIGADARAACLAGLLAPIDPAILAPAPDGTPAAEDFIDGAFGDCSVSQLVFATVIAYDDRAFPGEKPDSVADFFDLQAFPGGRALRREPVGALEWALRSYGVPRSQMYDLLSTERGLALAFRRLDSIRGSLVWWQGGEEPVELLTSGRVAMSSGYNGRFFHAQVVAGAPIEVIWESALLEHDTWAIPRGTPDRGLAERFIAFATGSDRLAAMAERISYGPARRSAMARVGLHAETGIPMRPHLPSAPLHMQKALVKDDAWYARTEDIRHRRFRAWLEQGDPAESAPGPHAAAE